MTRFTRSLWLATAGLAAATGLPVVANAAEGGLVIEEVIVTAQKREQSAQDVPIAISAFDSQFLDDAGVDDVFELEFFVPGLTIYNNQSPAQTNINIRGVGTAGNSLSLESSVGLYIDGVYRSRQTSAIGDLIDVDRVEVLKGPQGTLFGRNTASGALQFLTVAPDVDAFGGYLEVQGGNEGYRHANGAINIPLGDGGTAGIRLTGAMTERDGYVDNITTGSELNDRDRWAVRAQLLWLPTDTVEVRVIADKNEIDEVCCSAGNIFDGPADTLAAYVAAGGTIPPTAQLPGASFVVPVPLLGGDVVLAEDFDDRRAAFDIDPQAEIEEQGLSIEVAWDFNDTMTLTSVTAWREYEDDDNVDADFTSLDILAFSGGPTEQDTFTQELRIDGTLGDRTTFVTGLYYFQQDLDNLTLLGIGADANTYLTGGLLTQDLIPGGAPVCGAIGLGPLCTLPAFPEGEFSANISTQEHESWAVFAQADYEISDTLLFTLGLRYLDEQKDMNVTFTESIPSPIFAAFTPLSPLVPDVDGVEFEDSEVTGTVKLTWFATDNTMWYASYGRGYKSGGTNIDRVDPATGAPLIFDPEKSNSWEIGFKADVFDRRVRMNGAVYLVDFEDFQANSFVGTGFVLQNAGEIESRGVELDVMALATEWLTLAGGFAYVDAEYESFEGGSCIRTPFGASPDMGEPAFPVVCDSSGTQVGGTPEWTFYGSATAEHMLDNGNTLYGRLDVNWKDDIVNGNDADPNKQTDSYTLTNLRLGYRFGGERYEVALWGKNVFEEDYQGGGFNSVIREGSLSAYHTEPRTFGLTFRANFGD